MKELTPVAKTLLTFLNNIDELLVKSRNRKDARSVMNAFASYASNNNFAIPTDKVENFHAMLLDARVDTLSFIVKDIGADVIKKGFKKRS